MPSIAELEQELRQQDDNLKEVEEILSIMPDNQDALDMKSQVLSSKRELGAKIALLKPTSIATSPPPAPPPADKPRRDEARPPKELRDYRENEDVMARYAADRQFYPATIKSVMGPVAARVYTVQFKGYSGTETVRAHEIKPLSNSTFTQSSSAAPAQKRKADGTPAASSPVPGGSVLSAPPSIDSALAEALKSQPSKVSDGPARSAQPPKKVKTNKALDKAKNSWQDWQKKSSTGKIAKVANKESMFRTGEHHTAKVGFTGSGQTMRKDADRARHTYQNDDD